MRIHSGHLRGDDASACGQLDPLVQPPFITHAAFTHAAAQSGDLVRYALLLCDCQVEDFRDSPIDAGRGVWQPCREIAFAKRPHRRQPSEPVESTEVYPAMTSIRRIRSRLIWIIWGLI